MLERSCLSPGLGMLLCPSRGVRGGSWRDGGLSSSTETASPASPDLDHGIRLMNERGFKSPHLNVCKCYLTKF